MAQWRSLLVLVSLTVAFAGVLELLAYTLNQFRPPPNPSWGFIRSRYVAGEKGLVKDDVTYLLHHPYVGLFAVGGLAALVAITQLRGDLAVSLLRAAIVGAVALMLLARNFTGLRLELPFVPLAAFGVAFALDAAWSWRGRPRPLQSTRA